MIVLLQVTRAKFVDGNVLHHNVGRCYKMQVILNANVGTLSCNGLDRMDLSHNVFGALTFTSCTIPTESWFTSTAVRTVTVGAISILVTWIGIGRTFVYI